MARLLGTLCVGFLLAGCVNNAQHDAIAQQERFEAFKGVTVATFMGDTMLSLTDGYRVTDGKVFIFTGAARTMVFQGAAAYGVPAVTTDATCRMHVQAVNVSGKETAGDWRITGVTHNGRCRGI